jgi:hypothetical protein
VCAPAAFLATQVITGADGDVIPRVTRWSWGRTTVEFAGQMDVVQESVPSRVLMVVLLALALTAVVVWLVRPGLLQLLLALSGLMLVLGRLVAAVAWRYGETSPVVAEQGPPPSYDLLPAGILELAGLGLLLGGMVLMAMQAVRGGTLTGSAGPEPRAVRHLTGPPVGFSDEA